jgi:four helix bundle protein
MNPRDPRKSAPRLLPHERLDAYQAAVQLVEVAAAVPQVRGAADVIDQLRRSASSVALNCAEACGKHGKDRMRYFEIARGSALESAAALRVLAVLGAINESDHRVGHALCDRLYAMLTRLSRSRDQGR